MDSDDGAFAMVAVYHRGGVWALRHAVPEGLRAAGHVIGCDIALRRGDVTTFRETVAAEIRSDNPEIRVCDFGHVGDGGLNFNLVWPPEAGPMPAGLADNLRVPVAAGSVAGYGGDFQAAHGGGPPN